MEKATELNRNLDVWISISEARVSAARRGGTLSDEVAIARDIRDRLMRDDLSSSSDEEEAEAVDSLERPARQLERTMSP